jgi:two-component sensor histidine kinase
MTDDGVGMPKVLAPAKAGLGTSIVQAPAKQVGATVEVSDADPGTMVSIVHDHKVGGSLPGAV